MLAHDVHRRSLLMEGGGGDTQAGCPLTQNCGDRSD
jgi:hypothetical protein